MPKSPRREFIRGGSHWRQGERLKRKILLLAGDREIGEGEGKKERIRS